MTTLRTSAADVNYLSCSNGIWGLYEGSDHAQTLTTSPVTPLVLLPSHASSYSAVLKVCDNTTDLTLDHVQIAQGRENVLDLNNRAARISVEGDFGYGGGSGDQVFTVKGGCHDIKLVGSIYSRGNNADYVQDAWSDQCADLCSGIDLSWLTRADGQPVTIILGRFGSKIDRYPPSYRLLWWKSLGYRCYYLAKRAAVALNLMG